MKRRSFVKNIGMLSAAASFSAVLKTNTAYGSSSNFRLINSLSLKEFGDEHEEYPTLVSNQKGKSWLFSLRRLPFPKDKELISVFNFDGKSWDESKPVTSLAGKYEYPTASCAPGGSPAIAWTRIEEDNWNIEVSTATKNGFSDPVSFKPNSGKYIKPVLHTTTAGRTWLAWEKLDHGIFSICCTKFEDGKWSDILEIDDAKHSLFDPAMAEDETGNLFVAYDITAGVHQNIEMKKIDGKSLNISDHIPVAIGGGLKDRVNINSNPVLSFDASGRLWISWENNRKTHRLEDADNFTGDRICAMVCYENGVLKEQKYIGKWLFNGMNDHLPTFIKDSNNNLSMVTHCGGDFTGNPFWKYRISRLDLNKGWSTPETILETKQKGQTNRPALIFNDSGMWLANRSEKWFKNETELKKSPDSKSRTRLSKLELHQFEFQANKATDRPALSLSPTLVEEFLPDKNQTPIISGRPRIKRKTMRHKGETYSLLLGNLHEHTEISSCWPAGCDGTIHDDYRFGIYAEGYDFMGITDHGYSLNEIYWRKNLRMADFYTDNKNFVAIPSLEWTLSNGRGNTEIKPGVGHKNIFFPSKDEALKFIKNKNEIFSVNNEETKDAAALWHFLHQNEIDCITIPHHPADEVHPTDWEVHDDKYQPIVEIFQCRGNAEHPDCPREINVTRHNPIPNSKAYIDYALTEKKHKMGFIASGDHNGIGVGLAAVWVKEISQRGIVEAMKHRRCFATTGDKIFVHMTINGAWADEEATIIENAPEIQYEIESVDRLKSIEILRNSKVIKRITPSAGLSQKGSFTDHQTEMNSGVLYYYVRAIQENDHIGWSSPVWVNCVS